VHGRTEKVTGAGLSVLRFEFSADCGVVVNPKSEVYQPVAGTKPETISNATSSNDQTLGWGAGIMFRTLEHLYFEFVSKFEFRASNLVAAKGLRWDISL
jgi:hypothetical protein